MSANTNHCHLFDQFFVWDDLIDLSFIALESRSERQFFRSGQAP
jgi:hypothetical protein